MTLAPERPTTGAAPAEAPVGRAPAVGQPLDRVDGLAKTTGAARYAGEYPVPGLTHAVLVHATIARGRITLIDTAKSHASLFWADITGTLDFAESKLKDKLGASFDTDVKPFLQGFDSVIGTTVPGDSIDSGTVIISVSGG